MAIKPASMKKPGRVKMTKPKGMTKPNMVRGGLQKIRHRKRV